MKRNFIYDDLYVLINPLNNTIKFGRTKDFKRRKRNIITTSGIEEIKGLFHFKKEGDYERYFKNIFSKYNTTGEWYKKGRMINLLLVVLEHHKNREISIEELLTRFSLFEKVYGRVIDKRGIPSFTYFLNLSNPLYNSLIMVYNQIKKERKGIGWGLQKSLLEVSIDLKVEFRNYLYLINYSYLKCKFTREPKYDIENPTYHNIIETLRIKKNITSDRNIKNELQAEIDKLFMYIQIEQS